MIFDKIEDWFRQWNDDFKNKLQKMCPPGYELKTEYRIFWIWMTFSIIYSMRFLIEYVNAYDNLFYFNGQMRVLNLEMRMPGFFVLLDDAFDAFFLGVVILVFVFAMHYAYYRRESKSIYLMKRLKNRKLLRMSYFGTPCIYGLIFLGTGILLLIIYYMIYRFVTPQMCLGL